MELTDLFKCLDKSLEAAFLPKLNKDLDSVPIRSEEFVKYKKALQVQLPLIFDLVQQQKAKVFQNEKHHSLLVLLCCELTAPNTEYRLEDVQLLKNATSLLIDSQNQRNEIDAFVFDFYQNRLKKDEWKRHLGAIHGFEQYLLYTYNDERKLSAKWLGFCLSVALTVRDCHDSIYKHLGIRIFLILLKYAHPEDMSNLNIHSVIYDNVFKDVHLMESVAATEDIWHCLYLCSDFLQNIDSFNWSQVDDMIEVLNRNIPLAKNTEISICMFNFIPKMVAFFTLNHKEIMLKSSLKVTAKDELERICECCAANTSYSCFRWAKIILDLIIYESYKLMKDTETCLQFLRSINTCYMVCILPIPLQVAEAHLIQFYEKFTSALMEVIVTHKQQKDVVQLVRQTLEIFQWQLKQSNYVEQSPRLLTLRQAFHQLLEHAIISQK